MKLVLEKPFSDMYDYGYIHTDKKGRAFVSLFKDHKAVSSTAYARYLISVKLGRFLTKDEQVDHIDNDRTNDSIENLQILSASENAKKYYNTLPPHKHGTSVMYKDGCRCQLCCAYMDKHRTAYYKKTAATKSIKRVCQACGSDFYVNIYHKNARYCSQACANKLNAIKRRKCTASDDEIRETVERLGSWSKAAAHYGVTIAALKFRLGLYK